MHPVGVRWRAGTAAALGSLLLGLAACSSGAVPSDAAPPSANPTGSPSVAPDAPATSSAPDRASPGTSAPAGAPRISWSEVEFDGHIADLIGDGDRFVAVGAEGSAVSSWTSLDGLTWERHGVPEQSFGQFPNGADMTAGMRSLVRLGETLYSFGATPIFIDASHGAGWRWTDGGAWEAIQSTSPFFAGEVLAVTASDEALVASTITFGGPRGIPAVWRWTPATSWTMTSLSSDVLVDVLTWADGTYLAAGSRAVDGAAVPSMWISTDGAEWSSVELPEGLSDVCALTSTAAAGFVAFGRAGDRVAAWTSTDGVTWVEGTVENADAAGTDDPHNLPVACGLVTADDALVAVMQLDGASTWTSRDGASWEFQEELEASGARAAANDRRVPLAAVGRQLLLAGTRSDPGEPDGLRQVLFVGVVEP
jgi:hypothetical protein